MPAEYWYEIRTEGTIHRVDREEHFLAAEKAYQGAREFASPGDKVTLVLVKVVHQHVEPEPTPDPIEMEAVAAPAA